LVAAFALFASLVLGVSFVSAAPPAVTIDPPASSAFSAHLSGTIDPADTQTYFYFQYSKDPATEGWVNGPHAYEKPLPANSGPTAVSEDIVGLAPVTEYKVRLVAENFADPAVYSPELAFSTEAAAPSATTIAATVAEGGTSATVGGRVNPNNSPTTYWIEYGTTDNYGQNAPPTKDATVGSGMETTVVSQPLSGLTPGTTYHFRVVAENPTGTTVGQDLTFETSSAAGPSPGEACPNQAFRVGPSANLPDCRAYEQISPPDKNESNAGDISSFTPDGEHALFRATGAFLGASRGGVNSYLGTRTKEGWLAKAVTPALPLETPNSANPPLTLLSEDGSGLLIGTSDPLVAADTNHRNDYYLLGADGSLDWISRETAIFPPAETFFFPGRWTADFSHVVFQDTRKRVAGAAGLDDEAYGLYDATTGRLTLVNVDSQGELISPYGAGLGSGVGGRYEHAISSDGERIFFSTPDDMAAATEPIPPPFDIKRIYLRESDQTTTEISAPQCTQPSCEEPEQDSEYQGAAADGSVAFFTSSAQLTNSATPGGGLYRYDVGDGKLTLLTPDATDPGGAAVEGEVANSDDGSMVYFVARGRLAAGSTLGSDNLYLFDAATGATTFIATLDPSDSDVWAGTDSSQPVEVTPAGSDLVFRSTAPLAAGYDNAGHYEIYRYDATSGNLSCVSCGPAGTPAQNDASFSQSNASLKNNMSDDGSYVFFQTAAPLLSRDRNDQLDVYQWHDDTVSLISSGTSSGASEFGGATESGRDVGFSTWQRLVSSDDDEHLDVYDARVDGGFQQSLTPPPVTPCSGDACRSKTAGSAEQLSPASAAFNAGERASPGGRSGPFQVSAISAGQARSWAKTGRLRLRVRVPAAGRVQATVSARLSRRTSKVARAAVSAQRSGTVSLALRLSKTARSYLDRDGQLPVTIDIAYSKSKVTERMRVRLIAQGSKQARRRGHR
jgi:hypothetical protein